MSGQLFSVFAATEVGADETGQDISIEAGDASGCQQFPCDGGHGSVVGAKFRGCDEQFDTFFAAHGAEGLSEGSVRCDSTADAQAGVFQQPDCLSAFFDHDFDGCSLEAGGEVGDQFGRCAGELIRAGDAACGVEHSGFKSGETEVQFS